MNYNFIFIVKFNSQSGCFLKVVFGRKCSYFFCYRV